MAAASLGREPALPAPSCGTDMDETPAPAPAPAPIPVPAPCKEGAVPSSAGTMAVAVDAAAGAGTAARVVAREGGSCALPGAPCPTAALEGAVAPLNSRSPPLASPPLVSRSRLLRGGRGGREARSGLPVESRSRSPGPGPGSRLLCLKASTCGYFTKRKHYIPSEF